MMRLAASVLCALLLVPAPATAADAGARSTALARELMSPFCPGLLLADCRSSAAQELRAEIRDRFERGETEDDIVRDLVARFGSHVRAVPPMEGFGLLAWVFPPFMAAATFLALAWRVRRATPHGHIQEKIVPADDPAMTARLEQELWALD
jgi:cytochrome c-type biogenesis protein CcmH/NrfF